MPSRPDRSRSRRLTPKGSDPNLARTAKPARRGRDGNDPRPWTATTLDLPESHGWRAKPGHKIFIADRGAFRVDYPQSWHIAPQEDNSIALMDAPTNAACNARLKVTVFHLPPADWTGLPVAGLIRDCVLKDDAEAYRKVTGKDPNERATYDPTIHEGARDGLEWAWAQGEWVDHDDTGRLITTRSLFARGHVARTSQALCTYDVFKDRATEFEPFWETVLETMQLGHYYADPANRLM